MIEISVKYDIIGLDNGSSPVQGQAIIWTNAGISFIEPIRKKFSQILIKKFKSFLLKKAFENVVCKKRHLFPAWCYGLNCYTILPSGVWDMTSKNRFVIGWSKYRLGLPCITMDYGLVWLVGISTVFLRPLTVPLHCPTGRRVAMIVQWDCGIV